MLQSLIKLIGEKTGVNKGDLSSIGTSSGFIIALALLYFVRQDQYEADKKIDRDQIGKLWHQCHTMQNYLAANGIYIPDIDGDAPNTTTNLLKK